MWSSQHSWIVFTLCIGVVLGTECSTQNRTDNLAGCLTKMKDMIRNTDVFWFGDEYAISCPGGPFSDYTCANPSLQTKSLKTRLFGNNYDDVLLTKFIRVKFTSDPGSYTGCGNTFTYTDTTMFEIDPTSTDTVQPWFVRHTPEMTWDSTPGEYYSLYVYDAGNFIIHAVYINIEGNNIPTEGSNAIDSYHGPLRTFNTPNAYVFMLFKQDGYLEPLAAQEWYNASSMNAGFATSSHVPDFISLLNMTGPIGMNWMLAIGDEYASNTMSFLRISSTCPIFISRAVDNLPPRPFLPRPADLTVEMDVAFQVVELSFNACCIMYREPARSLTINPIGNELLQSSETRSGLHQTFTFKKLGMFFNAMNFTGEMFTMIAFDPDVPSATVGNSSHPLLHQMQINIMDGNFTSGEEVIPWNGPYPPNDQPHYYYFLLYKHTVPVTRTLMTSYAADCGSRLAGRCLYDINTAVSENNFTLVGATWFRAQRDLYVRYRNLDSDGSNADTVCATHPGYQPGCTYDTSAGLALSVSNALVFLGLISLLY